jgi:hypothetical protein
MGDRRGGAEQRRHQRTGDRQLEALPGGFDELGIVGQGQIPAQRKPLGRESEKLAGRETDDDDHDQGRDQEAHGREGRQRQPEITPTHVHLYLPRIRSVSQCCNKNTNSTTISSKIPTAAPAAAPGRRIGYGKFSRK